MLAETVILGASSLFQVYLPGIRATEEREEG